LHVAGFQLATHAIGDAANRLVLDAYETLEREHPRPGARHRIEHAQVLAPDDIRRFAGLGVLPSMQPTHCTSDMPWAAARLGTERLQGAYAWRSLRETGVVLPAGSDAPVEDVSPLLGIYAAVTRQDLQGQPAAGWAPEQRLTRSEALRAFTSWAAYASFTEADLGSLEVGKLADFTVLDRDLMRIAPPEIPATGVLLTVVGGDVVHEAAGRRIDPQTP
jgi:predicted amidohydrolase YtcJ